MNDIPALLPLCNIRPYFDLDWPRLGYWISNTYVEKVIVSLLGKLLGRHLCRSCDFAAFFLIFTG